MLRRPKIFPGIKAMRTFAGTESQNGLFACIILYPSPLVRSTRPATCASTVVVDAAYRSGGKIFQVFRGGVFTFFNVTGYYAIFFTANRLPGR